MDRDVEHYFSRGLATATRKTYQAGQRHYMEFCNNSPTPGIGKHTVSLCDSVGEQWNCSQYHKGILVSNAPTAHCKRAPGTKDGEDAKVISSAEGRTHYTAYKISNYEAADNPWNSVMD